MRRPSRTSTATWTSTSSSGPGAASGETRATRVRDARDESTRRARRESDASRILVAREKSRTRAPFRAPGAPRTRALCFARRQTPPPSRRSQNGFLEHYEADGRELAFVGRLLDASGAEIYGGLRTSPAVFDVDGDGDPDLVLGDESGALAYYENSGGRGPFRFAYAGDLAAGDRHAKPAFLGAGDAPTLVVGGAAGALAAYAAPRKPGWTPAPTPTPRATTTTTTTTTTAPDDDGFGFGFP